jgi:hypothetical protein
MRVRIAVLLAVLLAAAAALPALAAQAPPGADGGRYAAHNAGGSVAFVVRHFQVTGLQVRMPLSCRNSRTHRLTAATLAFGASGRPTTYSRIYLPADGSANIAFVADDNARRPEIYLSLQLSRGGGHVSVHARSRVARETCSGELGFDVRTVGP